MNAIWPSVRVRAAGIALALASASALLFADGASATPAGACRDQLCAGAIRVGSVPVSWASPEVFYPNNEDLFAGVYVGSRPLAEVRRYGPALCRHRFTGFRISVVVKACLPEANLRVRATSSRKTLKLLRITYAAQPDIGGDTEMAASTATIYDGLTQITGLATTGGSSGL